MDNELKTNAVSLSPEEQYQVRKSIIRLSKQGKNNTEIAEILDVSLRHVQSTKKMYKDGGIDGIKSKKRGRKKGEKRALTPEQEKEIRAIIADKYPEQIKLPGCMWTRSNIRDLIKRKYKINMPLSTLGYYLSRWGFSVQRPRKQAYKQDAEKVDNATHHHMDRVKDIAEEYGFTVLFLPKYSPDFNPIELYWANIKTWLRLHFEKFDSFWEGLVRAFGVR